MKNYLVALLLAGLTMPGCTPKTPDKTPVAKVGETYLYLEDLSEVVPQSLKGADSTLWVDDFIRKWIQNELLILNAEQNLSDKQKDVQAELDEYRNSLLTFRYKKELMEQKMDTVITTSEISAYYSKNLGRYKLNDDIVKAVYFKIPLEVANPELLKTLITTDDSDNLNQLNEYGIQYAKVFDRFDDHWVDWSTLKDQIPEEINIDQQILRRNKFIESSDTDYYYFICIRDFRQKNENAPVEYVENEIRNILLNERKIQFLKNIDEDVYKEGLASNKFKIYNIKK
ncbi:hypothetical protein [Mangrovibacterium marinum]|uniref:Peptidyl-prolyl cis-trans isomerase n=1 Tax=Mangrovibacterium marinum TaxID=1639118 RepID=A0A2T5BY18_9BACT|nr:hypothetical protein [Mangrovibacterium marinum]PTN06345.1 hypothetical protein C8N47_12227 [Mangrovibacterium marinum]